MRKDNGQPTEQYRLLEQQAGSHIAQLSMQVLKGSFARKSWPNSMEAASRFSMAASLFHDHFEDRDIRYCFEDAASRLRVNLREADLWEQAAAEGARYHIQNLSSPGNAYGHRDARRAGFIAAVEEAIKSGRR